MLSIIGGLLGGLPGIATAVLGWLSKRSDAEVQKLQTVTGADRDVMIATLQAQVASNNAKASILTLPGMKILLFLLYSPLILHVLMIELGRVHFINWDVMGFDPWEMDLLKSLYITIPAVSVSSGFTAWLHK